MSESRPAQPLRADPSHTADANHGGTQRMPLSESEVKEALRIVTDWLSASELPGSAAAREGVADTIPLVMMGLVEAAGAVGVGAPLQPHVRALSGADRPQELQASGIYEPVRASFH